MLPYHHNCITIGTLVCYFKTLYNVERALSFVWKRASQLLKLKQNTFCLCCTCSLFKDSMFDTAALRGSHLCCRRQLFTLSLTAGYCVAAIIVLTFVGYTCQELVLKKMELLYCALGLRNKILRHLWHVFWKCLYLRTANVVNGGYMVSVTVWEGDRQLCTT